ncbi:MAG: glycosyltransferase family 4 protein [Armatimonadetes bacterium]|nr:glycosyltransferase family 4 protein [Armatimonadota bacterium]
MLDSEPAGSPRKRSRGCHEDRVGWLAAGRSLLRGGAAGGGRHEFLLFVGDRFDAYLERFHPDGFCDHPGLTIVRSGFDNGSRLRRIWWQQVVLPRLVHGSGAGVFHGPAYLVPAAMRTPSVLSLYDLLLYEAPQFCTRSNRWHYRLALPAGVRQAERVIVPSAYTRGAVGRWLLDAYSRTVVIPLGVEHRFAEPARLEFDLRERFRLPERFLLWVGNVEPKKNVPLLIDALLALRRRGEEVPCLVIAGSLSWGTNDLMRAFLASGLETRVVFLGRVRDEHLPALYQQAEAFVFPSLGEGFGLPVAEAMAAGVPVLVSDDGALPEVAGDAGLVLPARDPAAWADGIARVWHDVELRESLRARGRARAVGLSWERTAAATIAVYEAVAEETRMGTPRKKPAPALPPPSDPPRRRRPAKGIMWPGGSADFDERTGERNIMHTGGSADFDERTGERHGTPSAAGEDSHAQPDR